MVKLEFVFLTFEVAKLDFFDLSIYMWRKTVVSSFHGCSVNSQVRQFISLLLAILGLMFTQDRQNFIHSRLRCSQNGHSFEGVDRHQIYHSLASAHSRSFRSLYFLSEQVLAAARHSIFGNNDNVFSRWLSIESRSTWYQASVDVTSFRIVTWSLATFDYELNLEKRNLIFEIQVCACANIKAGDSKNGNIPSRASVAHKK